MWPGRVLCMLHDRVGQRNRRFFLLCGKRAAFSVAEHTQTTSNAANVYRNRVETEKIINSYAWICCVCSVLVFVRLFLYFFPMLLFCLLLVQRDCIAARSLWTVFSSTHSVCVLVLTAWSACVCAHCGWSIVSKFMVFFFFIIRSNDGFSVVAIAITSRETHSRGNESRRERNGARKREKWSEREREGEKERRRERARETLECFSENYRVGRDGCAQWKLCPANNARLEPFQQYKNPCQQIKWDGKSFAAKLFLSAQICAIIRQTPPLNALNSIYILSHSPRLLR